MAKVLIAKTVDVSECECCGCSYADGASIHVDGKLHTVLSPIAACFDGASYDEDDIFREVLRSLNVNVVYSSEYGYCRRLLLSLGHEIEVVPAKWPAASP